MCYGSNNNKANLFWAFAYNTGLIRLGCVRPVPGYWDVWRVTYVSWVEIVMSPVTVVGKSILLGRYSKVGKEEAGSRNYLLLKCEKKRTHCNNKIQLRIQDKKMRKDTLSR